MAKRSVGSPLPEEPWPLSARNLLSKREAKFYEILIALYPSHKVLVQVALSQLINVDRNHPQRDSIRARYKQLVADFVLCRPDLSVVTVIELDDRTHGWPKRRAADARKNKALADAEVRLVRIPAGRLPSSDTLRVLIDAEGRTVEDNCKEETALSLVATVDPREEISAPGWRDDPSAELGQQKRNALKAILAGVVLVGGWFIYHQFLRAVVQQAFQRSTPEQVRAVSAFPTMSAANAAQKGKDAAWAAFYWAPASCQHPVDWNAQVECGNQYMRAKRLFEERWVAEHSPSQSNRGDVVLYGGSVQGQHR